MATIDDAWNFDVARKYVSNKIAVLEMYKNRDALLASKYKNKMAFMHMHMYMYVVPSARVRPYT